MGEKRHLLVLNCFVLTLSPIEAYDEVEDYLQVIQTPMDLEKMMDKLNIGSLFLKANKNKQK